VSLRDLPATVVDILGLGHDTPFPGRSLARHWSASSASTAEHDEPLLTETADEIGDTPIGTTAGRSLLEQNKLYIRKKDGREELYDLATDPAESRDLSGSPAFAPLLAQFREKMLRIDAEAECLESLRRSARSGAGQPHSG
jgi:arylsulfatase A-like enzyme